MPCILQIIGRQESYSISWNPFSPPTKIQRQLKSTKMFILPERAAVLFLTNTGLAHELWFTPVMLSHVVCKLPSFPSFSPSTKQKQKTPHIFKEKSRIRKGKNKRSFISLSEKHVFLQRQKWQGFHNVCWPEKKLYFQKYEGNMFH